VFKFWKLSRLINNRLMLDPHTQLWSSGC